jgi:hypothetical protein
MSRIFLVVLALLLTGGRLAAQTPSTSTPPSTGKTSSVPSKADSVNAADIQRAADELVLAVQDAVRKVKDNPELKVATLKLAAASVTAAQVIITREATTLQQILESIARDVAASTADQTRKKAH